MEKNLGHATAYGYAKSKGYSGTEEEFAELMADYASVGQSAAQSAEQAAASAESASGSAASASQAAQTATSKASEAVTAADTATTKASEASTSADTASAAATSAGTSAQTATTAASTATTKASEAAASEAAALSAKTDAESARDAAVQSASEAAASAESIDPETLEHKAYGAYVVESASGSIASFPDGADNIPMKDVLVHIEPVQEGSGDPSPDNVRPISGWTGAKVTRTGVNVWDEEWEQGKISEKDDNVADSSRIRAKNLFSVKPGGTYYIVGARISWVEYDKERNFIRLGNNGSFVGANESFTVSNDAYYIRFFTTASYGGTYNHDISINYPSTDHDYHPFTGSDAYSITFPSEAGTVYGGTLDVTSGVLTVNMAYLTFDGTDTRGLAVGDTVTAGYKLLAIQLNAYDRPKGKVFATSATVPKLVCNQYKTVSPDAVYTKTQGATAVKVGLALRFYDESLQTVDAWTTAMSQTPLQVAYEIDEPFSIQLTPQEITSLLGANNVWADTGDSEVEYRADTKLYVDNKITQAIAAALNS